MNKKSISQQLHDGGYESVISKSISYKNDICLIVGFRVHSHNYISKVQKNTVHVIFCGLRSIQVAIHSKLC